MTGKVFSFKNIRIIILLSLLAAVLVYTQEQKRHTRYWYKPVTVSIFPINGDQQPQTAAYINSLSTNDFEDIDNFFADNAEQYGLITQQPFKTQLGPPIAQRPPSPPTDANVLAIMWWSLKMRLWAYRHTPDSLSNKNRVRVYVIYQQGADTQALEHSLGLQKGLIGVIHAYADKKQSKQNAVIMTHEILHTVGATDKYDQNNYPVYPEGFAQPTQQPLYPQLAAEIMAGRIAVSATEAQIPSSLKHVIVGQTTAREINWIK